MPRGRRGAARPRGGRRHGHDARLRARPRSACSSSASAAPERAVEHLDATARLCAQYGNRDPSTVPSARPDRGARRAPGEREPRAGRAGRVRGAGRARAPLVADRRGGALPRDARGRLRAVVRARLRRARRRRLAVRARPHGARATASGCGARGGCARRASSCGRALERFEALGAAPWAARARSGAARSGRRGRAGADRRRPAS